MKKKLLLVAVITASMLVSAQAPSPYPYFSYKKHDGVTPTYSVPDVAIASASSLDAVANSLNTQGLGLQCVNFDQQSQYNASTYVDDYLKTCGLTPSAFAETAANTVIRGWVADEVSPFVAGSVYSTKNEPCLGFNANPQTFRYSGGWYYYTVNFTEAAEYEFFLRLRSGNMRQVGKLVSGAPQDVDKIITVQIYNKSDMASPLKTWTLNYGGIVVSANPAASTVSTDASVSFHAWAKGSGTPFAPTAGQAASFWSKAAQTYTIPAVGEYVIKITDPTLKITGQDTTPAAGETNNAVGSFTFIKKTLSGVDNVSTVNALATVVSKEIKFSSNVINVDVFDLAGSKIKSERINNNSILMNNTGMYLVKMYTSEGNKVQKVIVK